MPEVLTQNNVPEMNFFLLLFIDALVQINYIPNTHTQKNSFFYAYRIGTDTDTFVEREFNFKKILLVKIDAQEFQKALHSLLHLSVASKLTL